ncbi:DUF3789 domain-containing protein [Heyndrickxia camelliae]|uniref:DUF3789 domain-containing protein n=1 Tax=Heyndrickxia camelliae TaxID=1707093 RepID=A0A2N3LG58_9BACI|nr:hypothetical protein CWO92_18440 [Heyndrickxia camelliae]
MVTSFNRKKVVDILYAITIIISFIIGSFVGVGIMCLMSIAKESDNQLYGGGWNGNKETVTEDGN